MARNALLQSYRAEGVAGNYNRIKEPAGGVSYLFQTHGESYGPSHAALDQWKKSGVPTADTMQTTVFGMSTRRGDTAGDALTFKPPPEDPPPNFARAPAGKKSRPNPITWLGGEPEEPPEQKHAAAVAPPADDAHPPYIPQQSHQPELSPQQMQETWAQLLRTGKAPGHQSSAQCLIDMPPNYAIEPPPPRPTVNDQSLLTIGLHPQNGNRAVRRSSHFTSDFRDPYA